MKLGSRMYSVARRNPKGNGLVRGILYKAFPWWRRSQALLEDSRILRSIMETSGMLVAVVDPLGRVVRFNRECERRTGFSSHEVEGRPISEFLRPEGGDGPPAGFFDASDSGRFPNRFTCPLITCDGEAVPVAWLNSAVLDRGGRVRLIVSAGMDVSDGERALKELELFRNGLHDRGEVVFLTDRDGKITYVNPAFEEIYRIPADLALGETPSILNAEVQPPEVYEEFWERLVLGEVYRGKMVNRTGDDRLIQVENSVSPVFGEDGTIVAFMAIQRDLTEEGAAGSPKEGREADVRELLEAVPTALALVTRDGILDYANPALLNLLGRTADRVNGRPLEVCLPVGDHGAFRRELLEPQGGPVDAKGEFLLERTVGAPTPVSVSARPMEAADRNLTLLSFQDLSDRKRFEDRIRHAQKMQAVGRLAGGIAHDFNNLLTVVQANAELLLKEVEDGQANGGQEDEGLQEILSASRRGRGLVQMLLAFSRKEHLTFANVDLGKMILGLRTPLGRLLPASIDIRVDVPDGLPPIWADEGSVEQVLLNLATNAGDAMPKGGTLSFRITRSRFPEAGEPGGTGGSSGEFLCINVTDEGVGMDAQTRDRAFEPFFTTKGIGDGAGLGMAGVYGLVKAHGGMVNLYSEVGEGTTVKVYLPVAAGTPSHRGPSEGPPGEKPPDEALPRGNETVLVVEDEPALRKAALKTLELVGYRVLVASDGEEGAQVFAENREEIDLVITDLIMPRMGGRGLYQAIKDQGSGVRFLFASGYDTEASDGERDLREVLPFIEKPWTIQEFTRKVRSVLDQAPAD